MMNEQTDIFVARIDHELRAAGNPARAAAEKRYLKSALEFLGVGVPAVRAIVKAARRGAPDLPREAVLAVAENLWAEPIHERRLAAVELLIAFNGTLEPDDLLLVERLCREAQTWALVDPLATAVAAPLVERYPELTATLDRWMADPEMWVRRAALLALLPPLRCGAGDFERVGRYADALLEEREFFIRKALGWVLREVSKRRPESVAAWLLPRAHRTSGVTVREAVKYLPPEQRDAILQAYRR